MEPSQEQSAFKLERLKYILLQIDKLNERPSKNIGFFQTIATAAITAGGAVFLLWRSDGLDEVGAVALIRALMGLLAFTSVYVVASVVADIFSWMDYRREECLIFEDVIGPGYRPPPRWRSLWRWSETYLIAFVLASTLAIWLFVELWAVPFVQTG